MVITQNEVVHEAPQDTNEFVNETEDSGGDVWQEISRQSLKDFATLRPQATDVSSGGASSSEKQIPAAEGQQPADAPKLFKAGEKEEPGFTTDNL